VRDVYDLARRESFANGFFYGGTGLSGNIVILALLYYGGSMVAEGVMSVGDLTSFFLYTAYVGGSFIGLSSFYSELMKGVGASSRIFDLLKPVDGIESQKTSVKRIEDIKGLIEFKNVRCELIC
jgi:ABC-type multidrug transport system fused ATPase/permease subunit